MRSHIKAVHDFIRSAYPLADADQVVDATFERAAGHVMRVDPDDARLWLLGEARSIVRDAADRSWLKTNADEVRRRLQSQGAVMEDWHAWADLQRLVDAFSRLTLDQQELLTIDIALEGIEAQRLGAILRVRTSKARKLLIRAQAALRREFGDTGPASEEVEP